MDLDVVKVPAARVVDRGKRTMSSFLKNTKQEATLKPIMSLPNSVTHVITDIGDIAQIWSLLGLNPSEVKLPYVVKSQWISDSITREKLLPLDPYLVWVKEKLAVDQSNPEILNGVENQSVSKDLVANLVQANEEDLAVTDECRVDEDDIVPTNESGVEEEKVSSWICQRAHPYSSSTTSDPAMSLKELLILELMQAANDYSQKGTRGHEHFKEMSYRKAVTAIRQFKGTIVSGSQLKHLPGIGEAMVKKVDEIIATKKLAKNSPSNQPEYFLYMKLFQKIHGIGATFALQLYQAGFRSYQDLRDALSRNELQLSQSQRIGLEYVEDCSERMERAEAEYIGKAVIDVIHEIDPNYECEIMGSFRRGLPTCGDVDILITHPEDENDVKRGEYGKRVGSRAAQSLSMYAFVTRLHERGILAADLVQIKPKDLTQGGESETSHPNTSIPGPGGNPLRSCMQTRYMGVVKSSTTGKYRRLDLLLVPPWSRGAALVHFTGNDIFNRSLRLCVSRQGMRLNEHGLFRNVLRGKKRLKLSDGECCAGATEQEIFEKLHLPYLKPSDRNPG